MARERGKKGNGEAADQSSGAFVDLTKLAGAVSSRTDTIESLAEDVLVLAEATAALTSEVRLVDYQRRRDKIQTRALFGFLTVLLVLMGIGLGVLLHLSTDNHKILTEVRSCTTPKGKCSQRGTAQTQKAVTELKLITIFAAECAAQNSQKPTDTVIRQCVETRLVASGYSVP